MAQHAGTGHGGEPRKGGAGNTIGSVEGLVVPTVVDSPQLQTHEGWTSTALPPAVLTSTQEHLAARQSTWTVNRYPWTSWQHSRKASRMPKRVATRWQRTSMQRNRMVLRVVTILRKLQMQRKKTSRHLQKLAKELGLVFLMYSVWVVSSVSLLRRGLTYQVIFLRTTSTMEYRTR